MNIINGKFNTEELSKIYNIEPFMGDVKELNIYNDTPYFNIQKFYNNGTLVGYAVIFLGYNSLTTSDASLEDVVYWQGTPEELEKFLEEVIKAQDYSIKVENIYYDPEKFEHLLCSDLDNLGFKAITRQR